MPLVLQFTPELFVELAPVMLTAPLFEQVVWLVPATAVGGGTTVAVICVLVADTHPVAVFLV